MDVAPYTFYLRACLDLCFSAAGYVTPAVNAFLERVCYGTGGTYIDNMACKPVGIK